jgi:Mg-chelatase subunit ChlD
MHKIEDDGSNRMTTNRIIMNTDFLLLPNSDPTSATIPCAIRLKAPENSSRNPTHIILLIDVSESMNDDRKLSNVKRCAASILNFLNESDTVSLITFGEQATLHLKQVPADQLHKDSIRARIEELQVDGCTNLSAGIGYVHEVCEGSSQKSGLLLLTDGHANRGVSDPTALCEIVCALRGRFTNLSIHCVGYGHDHNAELLQTITESVQGSYNVVNSIEDTAFAFGETLGGLMSCAYQNVMVSVPQGSIVHGPYITRTSSDDSSRMEILIGDVYSGTKPLVLVDIPRGAFTASAAPLVFVGAMVLPSFRLDYLHPIPYEVHTRQQDVELTRLRYTCTDILHAIKGIRRHDSIGIESITERLDTFATACADHFLDGHPVTNLLRGEIATMRSMLTQAMMGGMDSATNVLATQHITSIALGRGFSSPVVGNRRGGGGRGLRRMVARSVTPEPEEENPQNVEETQFAFQNSLQSQFASLMREQSQVPHT